MARQPSDDFTSHLTTLIERCLAAQKVAPQVVAEATDSMVQSLRTNFGGTTIYFPKKELSQDARAAQLYELWQQGTTAQALAAKFDLTLIYVWRLLNRERKRLGLYPPRR